MINFIKEQIRKYYDVLAYLVFGVLTTLVNYAVYLPLLLYGGYSAAAANAIAWVVAVTFAYLTNKPFVFKSNDWSLKTVLPECTRFVGSRVASGVMETVILFIFVDWLGMNGTIWKLITSVLVVVANYVFSKFLVFRKK